MLGLRLYFVTRLSTGKCIFVHYVVPVVQEFILGEVFWSALPLHRGGGGAPGPCWTEQGRSVPAYAQLPFLELVNNVNSIDCWRGPCELLVFPPEQAAWGLVFALLALCPLHITVTWPLQARRGTWIQNSPGLLMLPLKCLPFVFPVMPNLHSWKSHRAG